MRQGFVLLGVVLAAFLASDATLGYRETYLIGYGALCLMAAMISLTFLWLWARRATPLALGMSFGWAGASSVIGWWWVFNLLGHPDEMAENAWLFLALSLYFVGAILHFSVIQRSFGRYQAIFVLPVASSVVISALIRFAFW